jgi:hypothetical protein
MPTAPDASRSPAVENLLRVLWSAFLGGAVLYGLMPYFIPLSREDALPAAMQAGAYYAAAGAAAGAFITRRWWLHSIAAAAPDRKLMDDRTKAGAIVTWAITEAVSVIGLMRAYLSADPSSGLPFAVAALALLYLHRPAVWPSASLPIGMAPQ